MPYVMKARINEPVQVGDATIAAVADGGYMHFIIEAPMEMRIQRLDDGTILEEWRRRVYEPRGVKAQCLTAPKPA